MIKKEVVCDRCNREKPAYFFPKSKFGKNAVLCESCATYYFDISKTNTHCMQCGKIIESFKDSYERNDCYYCSELCLIRSFFDDTEQPCLFTKEHEEMLLDEENKKENEK